MKETLDAWLARVKSPVLGYIVLAFVLVNWKPLWFLVFADENGYAKINYFERHTDGLSLYFLPLAIGLLAAIAAPWVELLGALIARVPTRLRLEMQGQHDTDLQVASLRQVARLKAAQAEFERIGETQILERAARTKQAENLGSEVVADLTIFRSEAALDDIQQQNLTEVEEFMLKVLRTKDHELLLNVKLQNDPKFLKEMRVFFNDASLKRIEVDALAALNSLEKKGLAVYDHNHAWSLSSDGFRLADRFAQ